MSGLKGRRIAVAADRSAKTISSLIRKMGGDPAVYPVQGRQKLNMETSVRDVREYLSRPFDWVILTTGIGARTLSESAESIGTGVDFYKKLNEEVLAVRGKKTCDWLKENRLLPTLVSEDGTMKQLIQSLKSRIGQQVFLQAYNEDDVTWRRALESMGCEVYVSKPYSYESPDAEVMEGLIKEVADSTVDAVVFTSRRQVKNVFEHNQNVSLAQWNKNVATAAVGKVTAAELKQYGVKTVLQPKQQKMGAMIVKLDHYFQGYHLFH